MARCGSSVRLLGMPTVVLLDPFTSTLPMYSYSEYYKLTFGLWALYCSARKKVWRLAMTKFPRHEDDSADPPDRSNSVQKRKHKCSYRSTWISDLIIRNGAHISVEQRRRKKKNRHLLRSSSEQILTGRKKKQQSQTDTVLFHWMTDSFYGCGAMNNFVWLGRRSPPSSAHCLIGRFATPICNDTMLHEKSFECYTRCGRFFVLFAVLQRVASDFKTYECSMSANSCEKHALRNGVANRRV